MTTGCSTWRGSSRASRWRSPGIGASHVPTLLVAKVLAEHLDHGLFLSLPKIKAHRYAVVSLGIKGMQGTVMLSDQAPAYKQKWRMHRELGKYLDLRKGKDEDGGTVTPEESRKLYVASHPDVRRADGGRAGDRGAGRGARGGGAGDGGDGFQLLRPSAENVAIGGTNPVLVDRVGAAFLGLWNQPALARELGGHRTSPLIEVAARRFKLDLTAPAVTGDGAGLLEGPRPVHFKGMAPFAFDWDPPGAPPPAVYAFPAPVPAGSVAPEVHAAAPRSARPEVHAAALGEEAITLDGRGDEAAWARAAPVSWDSDYAGKATGISTRARFLWGKAGLYALFELAGAGLHTDVTQPVAVERKGLFKEDCVELFFTPDPARPKHYYEVELGPFGHFFDIDVDREAGKQDTAWSSGPDPRHAAGRGRAHGDHRGAARGPGDRGGARSRGAAAAGALPDGGAAGSALPRLEPAAHGQTQLSRAGGVRHAGDRRGTVTLRARRTEMLPEAARLPLTRRARVVRVRVSLCSTTTQLPELHRARKTGTPGSSASTSRAEEAPRVERPPRPEPLQGRPS